MTFEDLPQHQMHVRLAMCRVYVHPIRWTSLGLSLIEAMMLGLPVVALAATDAVEAVPREAGVLSTNPDTLVDAVVTLIKDPKPRDQCRALRGGPGPLHPPRAERRAAERVARQANLPRGAVLAGTTTLAELAGLVARARLVVCGDTGIAHLATAYRVPSVVLFGPVSPARWGPPAERRLHTALWSGRSGDPWAPRTDKGLLSISTSRVIDAVSTQLAESPREARTAGTGAGRGSRDSASRNGSSRWLNA